MANELTKVTDQNGVDHPFKDVSAFPRSEQAIVGAENFFVPFASDSKSGMTFIVDSNGVVDVDGEPSANYVNIKSVFTLKKGTYTVSGVPSGFGTNKMLIALYDMNNVQIAVDDGSGATFTLSADTQIQGYIYVYQAYGDFDHVKVYPMINIGTVVRSFVPFAMTNKELTDIANNSYANDLIGYIKTVVIKSANTTADQISAIEAFIASESNYAVRNFVTANANGQTNGVGMMYKYSASYAGFFYTSYLTDKLIIGRLYDGTWSTREV